jgi:hypothetical protein
VQQLLAKIAAVEGLNEKSSNPSKSGPELCTGEQT